MVYSQLNVEFKRAFNLNNLTTWFFIIILLPFLSFLMIMEGYVFFEPIHVFQEIVSGIVPLIFPVLVVIIYLTSFSREQKNNFITYTRPRVPLHIYILCKGLSNAILTGSIIFMMLLVSFVFPLYVEPHLSVINYSSSTTNNYDVTFSHFLQYGEFMYFLIYSSWITINAILYSSIAFLLLMVLKKSLIALSIPFLFYHIFNFVAGIFGEPRFSPISTLFPFNIESQPLWTVFIPFVLLFVFFVSLYTYIVLNRENWII